MPNELFYHFFGAGLIGGVSGLFLSLFIKEILVFSASSVDLDKMPHSVASDLGLHYLPMSLTWDTRAQLFKASVA